VLITLRFDFAAKLHHGLDDHIMANTKFGNRETIWQNKTHTTLQTTITIKEHNISMD